VKWFKADLHIHSVLSPCASLEMSPKAVMNMAKQRGLDLISITDHNSAANSLVYQKSAQRAGLDYIFGMEVQTSEEIHVIALFHDYESITNFDRELYQSLLPLDNDPDYFGDQVVIDENENIVRFETRALINSSKWSFEDMLTKIFRYDGFPIPAHVDSASYSVIAQLGFIPQNSGISAVELSAISNKKDLLTKYPYVKNFTEIYSSDAHYIVDIGKSVTEVFCEAPTLAELILACENKQGRKIKKR